MKNIAIIILIVLFISCNKKEEKEKNQSAIEKNTNFDFVKTFEGKIDNKYEIVCKLLSNNGKITGTYYYKNKVINIQLDGEINPNGEITLNEYDEKGNQTGIFKGVLNNSKIEGNWKKPNGSINLYFFLIESNTNYELTQKISLTDKYENISGRYEFENNSEGVSFVEINIKYLVNNKFKFHIVTSHESGCTGEVSGVGIITKDMLGKFTSDDCKLLTFKFSSKNIKIEEENCNLHGIRCSFDGTYIKTF